MAERKSSTNDDEMLKNAVEAARDFKDFDKVLLAVSLHPEWLTVIPEERKWAILHQVILSGHVGHLNQLLYLQKPNRSFRLLTDTRDGLTILAVAQKRDDIPSMLKYIEKLIKLDEMLNNARECKWNPCYDIVKENPSYFNEKTPYRRYYLIHQLIFADALDQFKRFESIPDFTFNFTIRCDQQKINIFARKHNCNRFAEYLEQRYPSLSKDDDSTYAEIAQAPTGAITRNDGLALMLQNSISMQYDDDSHEDPGAKVSRKELKQYTPPQPRIKTARRQTGNATNEANEKKYNEELLDNLTCPLTLAVFVDPGRY